MQGSLSILSPFHNKFNHFNHKGAHMLKDIKINVKAPFWCETILDYVIYTQLCYGCQYRTLLNM